MSLRDWLAAVRSRWTAWAQTRLGQQVNRFVRLAIVSGFVFWWGSGRVASTQALWGCAVAGFEVAVRQFFPVFSSSQDTKASDPPAA